MKEKYSTWSIFVFFCSKMNIAFSSDRTSEHDWEQHQYENNNNSNNTTTTTEQHLDMKIFLNAKQQMRKNSWTFNNENFMEAFRPSFASHHQTSPFPLTHALSRTRTQTHAHALGQGFRTSDTQSACSPPYMFDCISGQKGTSLKEFINPIQKSV